MSATVTSPQQTNPVAASMAPTVRDEVIASANNLPDLINKAKGTDPELAARLEGKATAASVTAPGVFAVYVVTLIATKLGLSWSDETDQIVAGAAVLVAGYVFHWIRNRSLLTTTAKVPAP